MATIGGVTCNITNVNIVSRHRNTLIPVTGSDNNNIVDSGYSGLVITVQGFETTQTVYDNVIEQFMEEGSNPLVLRSGWEYIIYSAELNPVMLTGTVDNYFPYSITLLCETPYQQSTSDVTRIKSITTNNQEWSQDNSSNNIETSGKVDAIPDIKVTGGAPGSTYNRTTGHGREDTDDTEYTEATNAWVLKKTFTYPQIVKRWTLATIGLDLKSDDSNWCVGGKVTYQAASLNGGAETDVPSGSWTEGHSSCPGSNTTDYYTKTVDCDIECAANEVLTVRFYAKGTSATAYIKNLVSTVTALGRNTTKNPVVYNIADTAVNCSPGNEIDKGMVYEINTDGTGTIDFDETFEDTAYLDSAYDFHHTAVTRDPWDNEIDIADDGYIYWKIDTKAPITGIPNLRSNINITLGTPTIQISSDGNTWYDIDTAIVDAVDTDYELESAGNLSLKGLTLFYFRYDCAKAAPAVCYLRFFNLDIDTITIDYEHPVISKSGVSTFKCDQHADSSMACDVTLTYRHRKWSG